MKKGQPLRFIANACGDDEASGEPPRESPDAHERDRAWLANLQSITDARILVRMIRRTVPAWRIEAIRRRLTKLLEIHDRRG